MISICFYLFWLSHIQLDYSINCFYFIYFIFYKALWQYNSVKNIYFNHLDGTIFANFKLKLALFSIFKEKFFAWRLYMKFGLATFWSKSFRILGESILALFSMKSWTLTWLTHILSRKLWMFVSLVLTLSGTSISFYMLYISDAVP